MNNRKLKETQQSISTFLSIVNPILELCLLSPKQIEEHHSGEHLTFSEQGLSFLMATVSLGLGLASEHGKFKIANNIFYNVGSLGLKSLFQKKPSFILNNSSHSYSCAEKKDTHPLELNEWYKKFKDDFNIAPYELNSYVNPSDLKVMHERLTKLANLVEEKSISPHFLFTPTATLLEIALDKKITLSAVDSLQELLELTIQLNCENIPLQIIKSDYDQFHHQDFLKLSINANNLKMSNYFLNHWRLKVNQPLDFTLDSIYSICLTAFALFEGYHQSKELFNPLNTVPSHKKIKRLTNLLALQVATLGIFKDNLSHIAIECLDLNFQDVQFNKIWASKEMINLIMCSNPDALIYLYQISPDKAKWFANQLLEDEFTLKNFFKNDRGRTLLMLQRLFHDIDAFQNVQTSSQLIKRVSSSCKELRKNAKVLSQACYSKRYNLFAHLNVDGCLSIISQTRDPKIHSEEMAYKIARPLFNYRKS